MSGDTRDRTGGTLTRRRRPNFDLITVRRMLPLVRRIVEDIVNDSAQLHKYQFEQEGLDRNKVSLSWPERQRRYYVHGEVARLQGRLDEERRELDDLGAVLFNPAVGSVGFPTVIHGQPAYFDWQLGEESVHFWHYDGESLRRPIPSNPADLALRPVGTA
ncbi:MAG: DUF2203 domain-containing protein [Gemmataceae bacterium]|nr:DUF2203 domain-containing protein [Gemmataceae bacterium]